MTTHQTIYTPIKPLSAPLTGTLKVPGDKSISHRSVLFSAMAEGTSHLDGVLDSQDVRSSMSVVQALGAQVQLDVQPDGSLAGTVTGWGNEGPRQPDAPLYCGNSGTTVRLLMGVLAPWPIQAQLTGDESLSRRPMARIFTPLQSMGATFSPEGRSTLPLCEQGGNLHAIEYQMPVASAQLKSAVLLAGVFASGTTRVTEPSCSRNHTELMLPSFGVQVEHGPGWAQVHGGQSMHACDVSVPADPSSAAFMCCAAAITPGSSLRLTQVSLNPARIGFINVLARMGAQIRVEPSGALGAEPYGDIVVQYSPQLTGTTVAESEIASLVDEIPILALVASVCSGATVFEDVSELRVKETDRAQAIIDGLALMGVEATCIGNALHIQGRKSLQVAPGTRFESGADHRLAMTWALAGMCASVEVEVGDFDSVAISYPGFMHDVATLQAAV